jgi:hypothetical protein
MSVFLNADFGDPEWWNQYYLKEKERGLDRTYDWYLDYTDRT